ncbi:MAG: response regulator [Chloroflexi bacterium]|nr:response regulator [Chloroflexota bacterium]
MAKVLVIEDVADSANLARKILTNYDHEVLVAMTGSGGLKLAIDERPDLVLLDLGLPDIDGQTLLGRLRTEAELGNTPIILCSAWPEEAARKMAHAYGFDGYISKPYKVVKFITVVDSHLGEQPDNIHDQN